MDSYRWMPLAELRDRRAEWRSLVCDGQFPNAFADPGWLLAWWDNLGEHHEPWTFVLADGKGSLRGLALLALDCSGAARTLGFAGGSWNGLETLVCASGEEVRFADALLGALHERRGEWDLWRIQRLPADSALAEILIAGHTPLQAATHGKRLQPYLELPDEIEKYEAQFGSKQRNTQRRKWRKLTELGAIPRAIEDPADAQNTLHELLGLRRRRATEQGQRHKHMGARFERFMQAAVAGLLPSGARLWTLELEGRSLASRLNLVAGSREHSYLLGLSEEHTNLSPGNSLELQAIRSAIEQGRSEFELGPGRDSYKYRLGGRDRELTRLVASSGSARGRTVTAFAAADLRLRDTRAADMLRRRLGMTPQKDTRKRSAHSGASSGSAFRKL